VDRDVLTRAWHLRSWGRSAWLIRHPWTSLRFLLGSRETTNFTYPLANTSELVEFLSRIVGLGNSVGSFVSELETDDELRKEIEDRLRARKDRNRRMEYGRRLGWYAIVRQTKPAIVFETGTHDGLGSTILARALERNRADGAPGKLYTFDIDPDAGWIVPPRLRPFVEFVRGPVKDTMPRLLEKLGAPIEVFLHDSLHTYEHERWELETVEPALGPRALLLSDNAHATVALKDHAASRDWLYAYWAERPRGHPYPGAGLGVAWPRDAASQRVTRPANRRS
jgi:hypothetical protein